MALQEWMNKTVSVVTNDGRNIVGNLRGFDQMVNIILEKSHERVFSESTGVEQVVLGLYMIRGDNIALIGELDENIDASMDLSEVRAPPMKPLTH